MSTVPSLDLIAAFRGVMDHGSLSAAARALGLSQPTVRRQIEALESQTGARLFTRASNGLTPTPMAHSLMPLAQSVTSEAEAFARSAASQTHLPEGIVRLTAPRVLATHTLPHALAGLRETHPAIHIELTATDQTENMVRRAADIAVRVTPPTQEALVALKLPTIPLGLYASRDRAHKYATQSLADTPFISDDRVRQIETGLSAAGHSVPETVVLRSDDALVQIAAIGSGLGVGVCHCAIARRLGLVRVFTEIETSLPCYLVMHEDQARITRIRVVFDHLAACLPDLTRDTADSSRSDPPRADAN
jgi:DNA-binding transcriptional LysR family regulator